MRTITLPPPVAAAFDRLTHRYAQAMGEIDADGNPTDEARRLLSIAVVQRGISAVTRELDASAPVGGEEEEVAWGSRGGCVMHADCPRCAELEARLVEIRAERDRLRKRLAGVLARADLLLAVLPKDSEEANA